VGVRNTIDAASAFVAFVGADQGVSGDGARRAPPLQAGPLF